MANYEDLFGLGTNTELKNRVVVAVMIKADAIAALATPTQLQIDWAKDVFASPIVVGEVVYRAVVAANSTATIAQITGASDASIQTNVDAIADNLFTKLGV